MPDGDETRPVASINDPTAALATVATEGAVAIGEGGAVAEGAGEVGV